MKLIVLLDEKISNSIVDDEDIILTDNQNIINNSNLLNATVKRIDYTINDHDVELSNSITKFFNLHIEDNDEFRNVYFARYFRPITAIITNAINLIEEYKITKLVLVGGSSYKYNTIIGGNGEGKKQFYKTSWSINFILKSIVEKNYDIEIIWKKKKDRFFMFIHNYLRNVFCIYGAFYIKILKCKISREESGKKKDVYGENRIFGVAFLSLQAQYLETLFSHHSINNYQIISQKKIAVVRDKSVIMNPLSFHQTIINFRESKIRIQNDLFFKYNNIEFKIERKTFTLNLRLLRFQHKYTVQQLINTFNKLGGTNSDRIVTDMTYGNNIIAVNEVAKKISMNHINLQYVAMSKMCFPKIDLADEYYLYSKKTYEFFKELSNKYKFYLPTLAEPKSRSYEKLIIEVIIFTQPDQYTEKYLLLVRNLIAYLKQINSTVRLSIKPHYRQDKILEFTNIIHKYKYGAIYDKSVGVKDLIVKSDVIISMTSSVLFEALMNGKMAIIANLDEEVEFYVQNNDICYPEVNIQCKTIQEIVDVITNYNDSYKIYREKYYRYMDLMGKHQNLNKILSQNKEV
ncbi:hypothetical protein [Peloplasma aerotolerans]|uniref:Capsule polysaccharide biosynthesis protein n=1 Tax=Peloplasma aerotolerans TaxID=3044389 RepID=A0AAW6U8L2_9MOLU|nr:hypothetical protein [Mariniplasma sp. M4Ah]MDI6452381.1 hypothetical protein [Mariniplasma sp. M4Ah]